jgi:tRNA-specific 2-thiouridylase
MSKVFVGLSGGVDSAVSAALLREQGHDVTGVFIRIYRPEFIECTWKEDRLDALRVCAHLGIPFREIDLSEEYKKEVVDSMVADYSRGITPNPDVLCNRVIKFGAFLDWSLQNGADKIATGHYAQIKQSQNNYQLLRGIDPNKDQSYFLYRLTRHQLSHSLFPVGQLEKSEVRRKAETLGLPNATKHDSQGLCFVGDVSMADFLARFIDLVPGAALDQSGMAVGTHQGAALLTLGQRHGFTLLKGEQVPHYVTAIDTKRNTVRVSTHRNDAASTHAHLSDTSWINDAPIDGTEVLVQTRYREKPIEATISFENGVCTIKFSGLHIAPPGQSLVIYKENECLGGGVICP